MGLDHIRAPQRLEHEHGFLGGDVARFGGEPGLDDAAAHQLVGRR
jgi:hypothetical protein